MVDILFFLQILLRRVNMNYHVKSRASSLKMDWVMLILIFGGHFIFWRPFFFLQILLRRVNMNYLAKSRASGLKFDWVMLILIFGGHSVFWQPFYFLAAILFFGGHFFLLQILVRMVNMNYHAKSGASSLKIEWLMINFVIWRVMINFVIWWTFFLIEFFAEGKYELPWKIWRLSE